MATSTMGALHISTIDSANRASTQRLNGATITPINFTAQAGLVSDLLSRTAALSLGFQTRSLSGNETMTYPVVIPSDANAQRGSKFAVSYVDSVGNKRTTQIAVAKYAAATYSNGDVILSGAGASTEVITYVAAFESYVLSDQGNPVTVTRIRTIGRHFGM